MSTHNIPFSIYKKENPLNYEETQGGSRGKRAISIRATEVLHYIYIHVMAEF